MAIEEANAEGGYEGVPFELLARWSENPWGSGVSEVAKLAYEDGVWAILGSVDGPGTHLAEQIVAKARLTLVSPVSTDVSVNLAGVPWMFSLAPSDSIWATALVDRLLEVASRGAFVLVVATDHDSRLAAASLVTELSRRDRGPSLRIESSPDSEISAGQIADLLATKPAAILLAAGPRHSARWVRRFREAGFGGPVFGTPQMGRSAFHHELGVHDSNLLFPELFTPSPRSQAFVESFRKRTGNSPDWAAAHTYDATRLLLEAIDEAGLDRARIRQSVADLSPWQGLTGEITWNAIGQNVRKVKTMTWTSGRLGESKATQIR